MSEEHEWDEARADELRARLRGLAEAAGLPVPRLEIEPPVKEQTLARIRGPRSEERILVPASLLDAGASEQTWQLAACIGWWASPVPRRRRRQTIAALVGVAIPYTVLGLAELAGLSNWPVRVTLFLLGALVPFMIAACLRRERRALDAAGHDILRAAGYDPASLALLVFGGQTDPPLLRRLASTQPSPSERITAAGEGRP